MRKRQVIVIIMSIFIIFSIAVFIRFASGPNDYPYKRPGEIDVYGIKKNAASKELSQSEKSEVADTIKRYLTSFYSMNPSNSKDSVPLLNSMVEPSYYSTNQEASNEIIAHSLTLKPLSISIKNLVYEPVIYKKDGKTYDGASTYVYMRYHQEVPNSKHNDRLRLITDDFTDTWSFVLIHKDNTWVFVELSNGLKYAPVELTEDVE